MFSHLLQDYRHSVPVQALWHAGNKVIKSYSTHWKVKSFTKWLKEPKHNKRGCLEKSFTARRWASPAALYPAVPTPPATGQGPACFSHYYPMIYSPDSGGRLKFVDIPRPAQPSNMTPTRFLVKTRSVQSVAVTKREIWNKGDPLWSENLWHAFSC